METMLMSFATKEELIAARTSQAAYDNYEAGHFEDMTEATDIAGRVARTEAVYVPHLYRGGWVIRGFGYSTERIGKYVTADVAGNPELV